MSVKSALARLERGAGVGRRCLACRVHYIKFGAEIRRTAEADLYISTCATCDQTLKFIHSGYTPRDRGVLIFVSAGGAAEQATATWVASYAWTRHYPRYQEVELIGETEEKRLRTLTGDPEARRKVKVLDEHKGRQDAALSVQAESPALPTGWQDVIAALEALRVKRKELGLADDVIFGLAVMAEMEVFMWGAKSEETVKRLEEAQAARRHAALERLAVLRRADEEREERRRREAEEQEERYRREREERERAQAARLSDSSRPGAAPVGTPKKEGAQDAPVSRFRKIGAPVPHNPMVVDPTAAHVPDPADPSKMIVVSPGVPVWDENDPEAVQFMRSTPERLPDAPTRRYYWGENYDGDPRY